MVEFKAEGGPGKGYLASPEKLRGGVLILHAWWGLNDFFKGFANRLASQGFLALAPDLHDGALATSVDGAKELHSKIADERVKQIVLGATDYLGSDPSISTQNRRRRIFNGRSMVSVTKHSEARKC